MNLAERGIGGLAHAGVRVQQRLEKRLNRPGITEPPATWDDVIAIDKKLKAQASGKRRSGLRGLRLPL